MKGKVLGIVIALLVVIAGVAGYFAYQKVEEEKTITDKINEIKSSKNDFSRAEEHTEKLNVLKAVLNEQKLYNSSKKHSAEVSKEYEQTISDMQKVFKDEYDANIQEDTLSDVDTIDDIDTINDSKDGLSKLLDTIKEEKKYTLDSDETYDEYKKNIDALTKTYTDRIASLEEEKKKAAEEEKARQLAEEEKKKKEEAAKQWDLYKTRYGDIYNVDAQKFQFKIPSGWNVESEEVGEPTDEIQEKVVLSNDRGVTVTFWYLAHELGGRSGTVMIQAEITKADDAEFKPGYPNGTNTDFSSLGNFIVAKVHTIGELDMKNDSEFTPVDSGATFYALVPESYLGTREFVGQAGNVDEFSFKYPTPYAFIAESPDGTFNAEEESDVIEILKSFKAAE